MKYAIDRIEEDVVVLQNIDDGSIILESISNLPAPLHEGMILSFENDCYLIDNELEDKRRERIESKFNDLIVKDWLWFSLF